LIYEKRLIPTQAYMNRANTNSDITLPIFGSI
jgi:hypothetical protein